MKRFHKLIGIVLSLAMITLISGCGGSSSNTSNATNSSTTTTSTDTSTNSNKTPSTSNTGSVALNLTDAPTDDENIMGVYVTFTGLRYQYADSDDNWQDVDFSKPRTVDLLALQNGKTVLLDQTDLPAGVIGHIRFVLDVDKCYVELEGDIQEPLTIPSGDKTGYKAIGGFTIPEGGVVDVTADFDLRKSVTVTGNGKYKLRPTIKLVDIQIADEPVDDMGPGEINGTMTLDANGSSVIVYAYTDGSWDSNESNNNFGNSILSTDATDGNYTLPWLAEGKYDLIVVANDVTGVFENILGYLNDVTVVVGETTSQNITDDTLLDALP